MVSCFYKRNGITKEAGCGNFQFILLPFFFFLEKKEIRKRQGRHKGRHIRTKLHNTDPKHVTSETVITGSNRESIYYLLNLRYGITLPYIYLYDTGFVYDTNIQYTQLLSWAILVYQCYLILHLFIGLL